MSSFFIVKEAKEGQTGGNSIARFNIKKGNYENEAMLNMVEMAFRSYDPCLACSTHTPHGSLPLEIKIFDKDRKLKDVVRRQ